MRFRRTEEARDALKVGLQISDLFLRVPLAEVHREHTALPAAAKRSMLAVVVEDDHITGGRF